LKFSIINQELLNLEVLLIYQTKIALFTKEIIAGLRNSKLAGLIMPAMKLFYCLGNAEEVAEIIRKQELVKYEIKDIIDFTKLDQLAHSDPTSGINQDILEQFFTNHLQKNFKSSDLDVDSIKQIKIGLKKSIENKGLVIREIIQLAPETQQHVVGK
jgi:hypothetical protein